MSNKVTTVLGDEAELKDCLKIANRYFKKHYDNSVKLADTTGYVIKINMGDGEVWRRPSPINSDVDWSYTHNCYCFITPNHITGIIDENQNMGLFIPDKNSTTVKKYVYGGGSRGYSTPCIRKMDKIMAQSVIDGEMYLIPQDRMQAAALFEPYNSSNDYSQMAHKELTVHRMDNKGYPNFDVSSYGQQGNSGFERCASTSKKFWDAQKFDSTLDKYEKFIAFPTIGVEFEASQGYIPEQDCFNLGLVPVKDGSITGTSFEYITTVIADRKLAKLKVITEMMQRKLSVNESCSLHTHIGGISNDPETVVAMWMLLYQLRGELFQMLPPYKKSLDYFKSKRQAFKDHCKDLPPLGLMDACPRHKKGYTKKEYDAFIQEGFQTILSFLNEGNSPKKDSSGMYKHIREGKPKWEFNSRYYMVNFLPWLFENKRTIEFRSHSGTVNSDKTLNWVFIVNSIVKYAVENKEAIITMRDKLNLTDLIEYAYNDAEELVEYLKDYVLSRKASNMSMDTRHDIYGDEFTNDNYYHFKHKNSPYTPFIKKGR